MLAYGISGMSNGLDLLTYLLHRYDTVFTVPLILIVFWRPVRNVAKI